MTTNVSRSLITVSGYYPGVVALDLVFAIALLGSQPAALAAMNPASSQSTASTSATTKSTVTGGVPVIYAGYLDPKPLSQKQVDYILSEAKKFKPADCSLWFVLVLWHHKDSYLADVYFSPDEQTPRLRKGRYRYVRDPKAAKTFEDLRRNLASQDSKETQLEHYVQVSAVDEPFDADLSVPKVPLLPFDQPVGISDSDVVAVVDLVRSGRHPEPTKRESGHIIIGTVFDAKLPIRRIERGSDSPKVLLPHTETDGKDLVIIHTGWQVNMLAGFGQIVCCKRTEHGYELLGEIHEWRS